MRFWYLSHMRAAKAQMSRVGTILPARVNPPHKTRVYLGWAIRSYYPLWAICGFYKFLVSWFSVDRYKSVEMILYCHILISLNGNQSSHQLLICSPELPFWVLRLLFFEGGYILLYGGTPNFWQRGLCDCCF